MITSNVHNVTSITISAPKQLEKTQAYTRDFTFEFGDERLVITVFSDDKQTLATKEALS